MSEQERKPIRKSLDVRRKLAATALPADVLIFLIYVRVSTGRQAEQDKVSLPEQETACRAVAERIASREGKRAMILPIFKDEGVSGEYDIEDRPGVNAALAMCLEGRCHYLLAWKLDRVARNASESLILERKLSRSGVKIATIEKEYRYDAMGRMDFSDRIAYTFQSLTAEKERSDIIERTELGRRGMAKQGKMPVRGHSPYGYRIWQKWEAQAGHCLPDEVGKYRIVAEQAEVVRQIFEMVAGGQSLYAVCRYLHNDLHLPSPTGKASWPARTIQKIITDPLYRGIGSYGKQHRRKDPSRLRDGLTATYTIPADPSSVVYFDVPAVVSPERWEAACERIRTNQSRLGGKPENKYLLTNFLRCPLCGGAMSGGRYGNMTVGSDQRKPYYVCCRRSHDYQRSATDETPRCKQPSVRAATIEERLGYAVLQVVSTPAVMSAAIREFQNEVQAHVATLTDTRSARRESLLRQKVEAERGHEAAQKAVQRFIERDPEADVARFIDDAKRHREKRAGLQQQIAQIDAGEAHLPPSHIQFTNVDADSLTRKVCGILARLPEALSSMVMSVTEKRELLETVIERVLPVEAGKDRRGARVWEVQIELLPHLLNAPHDAGQSYGLQSSVSATGEHSPVAGGIYGSRWGTAQEGCVSSV